MVGRAFGEGQVLKSVLLSTIDPAWQELGARAGLGGNGGCLFLGLRGEVRQYPGS
jgi:hypothetical protein